LLDPVRNLGTFCLHHRTFRRFRYPPGISNGVDPVENISLRVLSKKILFATIDLTNKNFLIGGNENSVDTYETIIVCSPLLSEEEIDEVVEKVKSLILKEGGEILTVSKWGKKTLAYPIRRHREGYYVLLEFQSPPTMVKELENLYRVTDRIIRYLTVKKEKVSQQVLTPKK